MSIFGVFRKENYKGVSTVLINLCEVRVVLNYTRKCNTLQEPSPFRIGFNI